MISQMSMLCLIILMEKLSGRFHFSEKQMARFLQLLQCAVLLIILFIVYSYATETEIITVPLKMVEFSYIKNFSINFISCSNTRIQTGRERILDIISSHCRKCISYGS